MKHTILNSEISDHDAIAEKIDDLLMEIYQYMPSDGSYPFTMIRLAQSELSDLNLASGLQGNVQLLMLKRTDFSKSDLVDNVTKSKDFLAVPSDTRMAFLQRYLDNYQELSAIKIWCEHIIGMGIGMAIQLAKQKGLSLSLVETSLTELDSHFGFRARKLSAFQLFNVRSLYRDIVNKTNNT
jgi:hypothetical protein